MYVSMWITCGPGACEEKGKGSPGSGVKDGCEPTDRYWEQNPDPLQEQQVLLTSKPSLQAPLAPFKRQSLTVKALLALSSFFLPPLLHTEMTTGATHVALNTSQSHLCTPHSTVL